MHRILGLLLAVFAPVAYAEPVYKCEHDGKITYTDQPCSSDAQPHALPKAIVVEPPARSERDLARQHDARIQREKTGRDREDAEWVKAHKNKKDREERVRKAIIERQVIKGMTTDEVRRALGEPQKVSRSESHGSPKESWTYSGNGETSKINFKNGEVSSVSRRSREKKSGK